MFAAVHNVVDSSITTGDKQTNEFDFWQSIDDDPIKSSIPFDATDIGLWNGRFVPPPPKPPFLDETVLSDGLTTCDLCSWAFRDKNVFSLEGSLEPSSELTWAFTIAVVSVLSAIIGAILMIMLLRCKRLKCANRTNTKLIPWFNRKSKVNLNNKDTLKPTTAENCPVTQSNPQVWIWLKNVNTEQTPEPMPFPPTNLIENFYTNTEESVGSPSKIGEVVYEEISGIG